MVDALIILQPHIPAASRTAVARLAPATQSISERVFLASVGEETLERLRAIDGVAAVLAGPAAGESLPVLEEDEGLFVRAWLSSRGQTKMRHGEGLSWDTPPMSPPDPKA